MRVCLLGFLNQFTQKQYVRLFVNALKEVVAMAAMSAATCSALTSWREQPNNLNFKPCTAAMWWVTSTADRSVRTAAAFTSGSRMRMIIEANSKESGSAGLCMQASNGLKTKQDRLLSSKNYQARAANASTTT